MCQAQATTGKQKGIDRAPAFKEINIQGRLLVHGPNNRTRGKSAKGLWRSLGVAANRSEEGEGWEHFVEVVII